MEHNDKAEKIRELRYKSGAGLLECKRALRRCGGDEHLALAELRNSGDEPPDPEPEPVE